MQCVEVGDDEDDAVVVDAGDDEKEGAARDI